MGKSRHLELACLKIWPAGLPATIGWQPVLPGNSNSRRYAHVDFVKARHTGEPTTIFFKFLHIAFAVGGADDEDVITCCIGRPFRLPKRPREIAAGVINLGV